MKLVKKICLMISLLIGMSIFAEPTITEVVAKQRFPWNGLVDIKCKVTGIENSWPYKFFIEAIRPDEGITNKVTQFWVVQNGMKQSNFNVNSNDDYHLIWDAKADFGSIRCTNMIVCVTIGLGGIQLWKNGPYWAECNVGATKPEEYGYYFWWGDTVGYTNTESGWNSVKGGRIWFIDEGKAASTSYKGKSSLLSAGYIDSTGNLAPAHDAATEYFGSPWRMPTEDEIGALINNCTTTWTTRNGVYGQLVTGKDNYSDKSIFLPATGYGSDTRLWYRGVLGCYWSSTPHSDYTQYACFLRFDSSGFAIPRPPAGGICRYTGLSVRPVR